MIKKIYLNIIVLYIVNDDIVIDMDACIFLIFSFIKFNASYYTNPVLHYIAFIGLKVL